MAIKFFNDVAVDSSVLYVDTVNDRVGIGTTSPVAKLHIDAPTGDFLKITESGANRLLLDSNGELILTPPPNWGAHFKVGQNVGAYQSAIQVGEGRTANGYSFIDFIGDTTYTDYGLRLIRNNTGANTTSQLVHRGTGNLELVSTDSGDIILNPNSGNVGIWTTDPKYKLQIGINGGLSSSIKFGTYDVPNNTRQYIGYSRADSGVFETTGNGDSEGAVLAGVSGIRISNRVGSLVSTKSDNSVQILTHIYNGSSRIAAHFDANGNVGIGTTSPRTKLHISGLTGDDDPSLGSSTAPLFVSNTANSYGLNIGVNNVGTSWLQAQSNTSATAYAISLNPLGGNVGIGTTSPQGLLHISSDSTPTLIIGTKTANQANSGAISFRELESISEVELRYNGADNAFKIWTKSFGDALTILRSNGYVGIGTTNPLTKLHTDFGTLTNGDVNELVLQSKADASTYYSSSAITGITFTNWSNGYTAGTLNRAAGIYGYNADTAERFGRYMGLSFYTSSLDASATEKMRIDQSGNVGIGTTNPIADAKLVIHNGDVDLEFSLDSAVPNTARIFSYDRVANAYRDLQLRSGQLTFYTGASERMRITSTGNVGIGTTNPGHELVVQGTSSPNIELKNSNYSNGGFVLNRTNYTQQWKWWAEFGQMYFGYATDETNYSNKLTIQSGGNVGIGTISPSSKLEVNTGTDGVISRFRGSTNTGVTISGGTYGGVALSAKIHHESSNRNLVLETNGTGKLYFNTNGANARMVITDGGSVGIGATNPSGKLEVRQGANNGNTGAFTNTHVKLTASATADNTGFVGITAATSTADNYGYSFGAQRTSGGVGSFKINYHNNSAAGTNRFIINQNGNVGIGTTNPGYKLEVIGDIYSSAYITANSGLDCYGDFYLTGYATMESGAEMYGQLDVYDNVYANAYFTNSDETLKTNIQELPGSAVNVNWKSFEFKEKQGETRVGVIAQELEQNHPEFVSTSKTGFKTVNYIELLIAKIAELETRIKQLENNG